MQRNIEERILRDALAHPHKIQSNYPRNVIARTIINTVLGWPGNRAEVLRAIDGMVGRATAVDGVTGEKGLANYSAFTIQSLALFLGQYMRMDPGFLPGLLPPGRYTYTMALETSCSEVGSK